MRLCASCGQPMKPPGVVKKPNEYDHAQGCPEARSCLGRFRYATKEEASEAGLRTKHAGLLRWYCVRCGGWHLTYERSSQ